MSGDVCLVAKEISDILNLVLDHSGSLEAQAPSDHSHVLWEAHWSQHLGSEHTAISHLHPLLELGVVAEYFHTGFRIRVVGGLEAQFSDADLLEEGLDGTNEIT